MLPLVDYYQYFSKLGFGDVGHHVPELVLKGGLQHDEVVAHRFGLIDLAHVAKSEMLLVVVRNESVV